MTTLNPQFIKDTAGNKLVVLSQKEYNKLLNDLEELEDIKMYDQAKKEDKGQRILLGEYIKKRNLKNAKL